MGSAKKGTFWTFICMCALGAWTGGGASAGTINVPAQQPTIQAALNAAHSGDTILVANGTYSGTGNYNIDFGGKGVTLKSLNGAANTIIDAQATQQSQRYVFNFHSNETSAAVVQGFTIKGGLAFNGPGLMITTSSPTFRDCVITENHANCWGGAMYFDGGANPTFTNCKFVNNFSADDGGAIFGFEGSPVFTNCLIANNEGTSTGGAILSWGSGHPKLMNCTVTGNHAGFGSAFYTNNLIVENSIVFGNLGDQQIRDGGTTTASVSYSDVQGGFAGTGNIDVTPRFVDPAAGNFHLQRQSACVDAGNPATSVPAGTMDIDGDPRSFGAHIDMGIDEFRKAGDVNGDHLVNIDDMVAVISSWGPCQINPADLNGNFMVDFDDLVIVITHFGG